MSFSITTQPPKASPVYNTIYAVVTSSNSNECSFRYICDVYVAGNLVTRLKQLPNLNGDGEFKVNRVLEDYVLNIPQTELLGFMSSNGQFIDYELQFGEEYDLSLTCDNSAITPAYNIATTGELFAWNAAIDYKEFTTFAFNRYSATSSTSKFLTTQPSEVLIDMGAESELYIFFSNTTDIARLAVRVYDESGLFATHYIPYALPSPFLPEDTLQIIGVGPQNINQYFNSLVIASNILYYDVQLETSGGALRSESKRFILDRRSTLSDTKYRFRWLNKLGGYDSYTFTLSNTRSVSNSKTEIDKLLSTTYTLGDRGRTVTSVDAKETLTSTSNWLTEEESAWIEGLYISPDVYVQDSNPIHCFIGVATLIANNAFLVVGKELDATIDDSVDYFVDNIDKVTNANYEGAQLLGATYNSLADGYELDSVTFNGYNGGGIFYLASYESANLPIVITSTEYTEKIKHKVKNINQTVAFQRAYGINTQRN